MGARRAVEGCREEDATLGSSCNPWSFLLPVWVPLRSHTLLGPQTDFWSQTPLFLFLDPNLSLAPRFSSSDLRLALLSSSNYSSQTYDFDFTLPPRVLSKRQPLLHPVCFFMCRLSWAPLSISRPFLRPDISHISLLSPNSWNHYDVSAWKTVPYPSFRIFRSKPSGSTPGNEFSRPEHNLWNLNDLLHFKSSWCGSGTKVTEVLTVW